MNKRDAALKRLGRNLRRLRTARGLTIEDTATACGLHRTYVNDIELGRRNPSYISLLKMAEVLRAKVLIITKKSN